MSERRPLDGRRLPFVVALLAFLLYSANGRGVSMGDSLPARFIPFALLGYGTVLLDPVAAAARNDHPGAYWIQPTRDGRLASLFPITTPMVVTPLYLPAVAYLSVTGWTEPRLRAMGAIMEKLAASIVAATTVGLMFVLLRRSTNLRDAKVLTIAFAAGTTAWTISGQALWQHGVGQMALVTALLMMTTTATGGRAALAGLASGILAANRPLDGLFAAALGVYAFHWAQGLRSLFVIAAGLPAAAALGYNLWAFGHVFGGYGATGHLSTTFFSHSVAEGIAGLLISPGKGLFVFSPFFLWLLWTNPFRGHPHRQLAAYLAIAVAIQVVLYAATDWRAGFYGYRFLTDATPVLIWLLVVPLAALTGVQRRWFVAAVAAAIGIQALGAFKYTGASDLVLNAPDRKAFFERVWRVDDSPILFEARQPFASMTLLDEFARLRCVTNRQPR